MQLISFCINTARNELNHIQLLFKSLQQNLSTLDHEILVFVDSDNQNTFEWLLTQKTVFKNLKILKNILDIPYGYQRNINELFLTAKHDIVSYLQSDMVVCKDYDIEVLKHLQPGSIICSTRIEPPLHGNSGEKITYDFGLDPELFDLEEFTLYAETHKTNRITQYFFAPFTLYKDTWNSIGGHDTRFRRSREDSDVLVRLVLNGTKIIQVWNALVYHFTCTSSRGKDWFDSNNTEAQQRAKLQQYADSIELNRFFRKWGRFSHSMDPLPVYNISAIINGSETKQNAHKLKLIEPFFNKIKTSDYFINSVLVDYKNRHTPANTLLRVESSVWDECCYMFNDDNYIQRITSNDIHDDVVITFSLDNLTESHVNTFILNLQDIIHQHDEIGEFSYDIFNIQVNKKQDISSEKIAIQNPIIQQQHLYTTH